MEKPALNVLYMRLISIHAKDKRWEIFDEYCTFLRTRLYSLPDTRPAMKPLQGIVFISTLCFSGAVPLVVALDYHFLFHLHHTVLIIFLQSTYLLELGLS